MKKHISTLILTLAANIATAQTPEWNYNSADYRTGEINITRGDGSTIASTINEMGVRQNGRAAPLLVMSTSSDSGPLVKKTIYKSTGAANYNGLTGIDAFDAVCNDEYPGYHFCSLEDLRFLGAQGRMLNVFSTYQFSRAWYNAAPSINNCGNFTIGDNSVSGQYISPNTSNQVWSGGASVCSSNYALVCCGN